MTRHIGPVGVRYIICRASQTTAEIRQLDSGREVAKIAIQGLNCSYDHQERLYCGTQFKKVVCVSSRSFKILGSISTKGSVNSLSLGFHPHTLIVGQTNGHISFLKINGDRLKAAEEAKRQQSAQSAANRPPVLQKLHELKLLDANISKVIRTTRDDLALGTSKGVHFYKVNQDFSMEPSCEAVCLTECDVTELSEFAIDKYVVAAWNSNDMLVVDRARPRDAPGILREPLWCNNLCTDLVPMPDYHPIVFPFYLSKSLRSIKLINFRTMKIFTLIETADMPTDCYGYKKLTLAKTPDGRLKIVFVTSENQSTIVSEVQFARNFRKALEVTGWREYVADDS